MGAGARRDRCQRTMHVAEDQSRAKGLARLDGHARPDVTVVPTYQVEHDRFVMEAAKIPAFADFLRNARADLCNFVSNPAFVAQAAAPEMYTDDAMRRLGRTVNQTLKIDDDWF